LGNQVVGIDADRRFHHYTPDSTLQSAMIGIAIDVFRAYPFHYIALIPVGLWRMLIDINPASGFALVVTIAWNIVLVAGMLAGLYIALRQKAWTLFWCVVLVTVYFVAGTILVQTSGMDARMRTMLTPLMATTCAYGFDQWRQRRAA
jgi:hypothetical protein